MKSRIIKRILSAALVTAMLLGNIGAGQGMSEVKAAGVNLEGLTEVTDADIENLYHKVSYSAQAVHDPSVIKSGNEYYVFGSHRGVAKTSNLREWTSVGASGLFGDSSGNIVTPENAFTENAFHGLITVAGTESGSTVAAVNAITEVTEEPSLESETEPEVTEEPSSEFETEPEVTEEPSLEFETEPEVTEEPSSEFETEEEASLETEAMEGFSLETEPAEENAIAGTEESQPEATAEEAGTEESQPEATAEEAGTEESQPEATAEEAGTEESQPEATAEEAGTEESQPEATEEESSTEESAQNEYAAVSVTEDFAAADTGKEISFGTFNAGAWNGASEGLAISGNLWAPDVVYNPVMDKYCMYMSLNGNHHNSVIVLMTADNIEGPYVYQGPVVYSGFTAQEGVATNWKNTDLEYALGSLESLPEKYQKITNVTVNEEGKITGAQNKWGDFWPHAIDPCIFYDENGKLWMAYGSWSGGIYTLELDENTGLRDYTVTYESDYDTKGQSVTSDAYFGTKIAGGYYVSGEGPYIEKIGDYYYLFMSYGFYDPNGGYAMRIFRSENPDGPYTDTKGTDAVYTSFARNFTADYGAIQDTRGMRLMTFYQWDHMSKGEVAQGHNSAIVDDDGRAYVIYHTKFNNNTADHELRVHELFQNRNGWILASPFAFAQDEALDYAKEPQNIAGDYEILLAEHALGYDKDSGDGKMNAPYTGPLAELVTISLKEDKTITKGTETVGEWSIVNGTPYADITIDGKTYAGVFATVTKDALGLKTLCFTAVDETTGVTLWGAKKLDDMAAIANNVNNPSFIVPTTVYGSFTLPSEGNDKAALYWESSNKSLVTDEGIIDSLPENDTVVTFTMTMVMGNYYYQKEYPITIAGTSTINSDKILVAKAFTEDVQDLASKMNGSLKMTNPFYKSNTNGLELSGGVSIEFDTAHTDAINALSALLAFQDSGSGKLYFTQASYLGYNADGGFYDANLFEYGLVTDYIGDAIAKSGKTTARVKINLNTDGFEVYVDDVLAYDQSILTTENGSATLTDYSKVLTWLQSSASTLYFGFGSWWNDAAANAVISNMEFYVNAADDEKAAAAVISGLESEIPASATENIKLPATGAFNTEITWESSHPDIIAADGTVTLPDKETAVTLTATVKKNSVQKTKAFIVTVKKPATSNAVLEKELLELKAADQIEIIDNPFYGKNLEQLIVKYDITFAEDAFKSGFDSVFAFYNSADNGRVSFQTNPYICFNAMAGEDNRWLDINHPNSKKIAETLERGKEYSFKIVLTKTECKMYLDDVLAVTLGESDVAGVNADFADVLVYISQCDKFTWGVGSSQSSFWGTELSTLRNISISSNEYTSERQDEINLETSAPVVMDNPLHGEALKEVVLDFTVNYSENAAMNGWDGLLSFFRPKNGVADGRVSIQTSPYICFNNSAGMWMDINNPQNLTDQGMTIPVTTLNKGTDYRYYISITPSALTMKINGETVEFHEASAGNATYQAILDFISDCQKFSWGVDQTNCFWGMEKCTLKNASLTGYIGTKPAEKVEVIINYPDGTTETLEVVKGSVIEEPEYAVESGEKLIWYTEETYENEWDFTTAVTEDMSLYGRIYYEGVEGIRIAVIKDQQYTGKAIKPTVVVYDGATKLNEKTDYKVSYTQNTKVGTAKITVTPCGNYEKTKKVITTFNIVPRKITLDNVTANYKAQLNVKYDRKKQPVGQTQKVTFKYGTVTIPSKEYTTSYYLNGEKRDKLTEAGTYQMVMETKEGSSFDGKLSYDVVVTDKVLTSGLKVTAAAKDYTGEAVTTDIKVTYKGKTVNVEENFDVVYADNVNAGTASVTLTAKADSDYYGSKTVTFKIKGTDIKKVSISGFQSKMGYTGEEITQTITLAMKKNGKVVKELTSKDYQISYSGNLNAGKATMTITGIGEFTGSMKKTFTISKSVLKNTDENLKTEFAGVTGDLTVMQDKSGAKPEIKVTYKEKVLVQDADYTVSYSNNKAVGTGKVTVKGKGNYSGQLTNILKFAIEAKSVTEDSVTIAAADLKYAVNGKYKAKLTVCDNGVKLASNEYQVSAVSDINIDPETQCGTAKVTVTGKKNYKDSKEVTVQIRKALISSAAVKVTGSYYYANGEEVSPTAENLTVTMGSGKNKVTLTEGKDFKITGYSNNTKAGKATLTLEGTGAYGGTKTVKYTILPKWMQLSSLK